MSQVGWAPPHPKKRSGCGAWGGSPTTTEKRRTTPTARGSSSDLQRPNGAGFICSLVPSTRKYKQDSLHQGSKDKKPPTSSSKVVMAVLTDAWQSQVVTQVTLTCMHVPLPSPNPTQSSIKLHESDDYTDMGRRGPGDVPHPLSLLAPATPSKAASSSQKVMAILT